MRVALGVMGCLLFLFLGFDLLLRFDFLLVQGRTLLGCQLLLQLDPVSDLVLHSIEVVVGVVVPLFLGIKRCHFIIGVQDGDIAAILYQLLAHIDMALLGCIEERGLPEYLVFDVDIRLLIYEDVDNVEPVLLGDIVQGSLTVQVGLVQVHTVLEQQLQTLSFAFAAHIKQNRLFDSVLEVVVGAVLQQQLHDLVGLLGISQHGGEVEGGLPELGLQPVDDDGVVLE